jgi:hypothetical protein
LSVFFVPETYEPVILAHKAARKRRETGDKRYFAAIEKNDLPWMRRLKNILGKPFVVFVQEPMLVAITVYMGVSYLGRMGGESVRAVLMQFGSLCMGAYISFSRRFRSCSRLGII